jgi:Arc/MetJ-type ribon-helix-helix transcriptional regulator
MSTRKVAISIDQQLLRRVDTLVRQKAFASRSGAIQQAVEEKLGRLDRSPLARECGKLDPKGEQGQADEGLDRDLAEWPEYWGARFAGPTSTQ